MTQEYEIIKKGLISLLCVGDKINYIYRGMGIFDAVTKKFTPTYRVMRCLITGIIDDKRITLMTIYDTHSVRLTRMTEVYKGELYLHDFGQPMDHERRLSKMAEILEDKETVYE
jgi:hypothetical protein